MASEILQLFPLPLTTIDIVIAVSVATAHNIFYFIQTLAKAEGAVQKHCFNASMEKLEQSS